MARKGIPTCKTCLHANRTAHGFSVCSNYRKCENYNRAGLLVSRKLWTAIPEQRRPVQAKKPKEKKDYRAELVRKTFEDINESVRKYGELTGKTTKEILMEVLEGFQKGHGGV